MILNEEVTECIIYLNMYEKGEIIEHIEPATVDKVSDSSIEKIIEFYKKFKVAASIENINNAQLVNLRNDLDQQEYDVSKDELEKELEHPILEESLEMETCFNSEARVVIQGLISREVMNNVIIESKQNIKIDKYKRKPLFSKARQILRKQRYRL